MADELSGCHGSGHVIVVFSLVFSREGTVVVYKRHIQALIPARISAQISHESGDPCMNIIKIPNFNFYEHDLHMATTVVLQVLSIRQMGGPI